MSEPPTLVASAARRDEHVVLTEPVPVPSHLTLSPGQPHWEQQMVYRCTGDGPYVAWLGLSDDVRGRLYGEHCAGSPVAVTEGLM